MTLAIEPLSQDNMADFLDFFDHRAFSDGSPYAPCYCNCFHLTAEEVCANVQGRADALGGGFEGWKTALRESAVDLIRRGVLQGYLAYVDGTAAGWCNANDQQNYIRVGSFEPHLRKPEDYYILPGKPGIIKSLVCFEVAPGFRGRGVAKALLARVCADAEKDGFQFVEVYPREAGERFELDFNGPRAMYQNAGFQEVRRWGKTIVMQKKL